jgi:hypothetical protein
MMPNGLGACSVFPLALFSRSLFSALTVPGSGTTAPVLGLTERPVKNPSRTPGRGGPGARRQRGAQVPEVTAEADDTNTASRSLLLRLGARRDGGSVEVIKCSADTALLIPVATTSATRRSNVARNAIRSR